MSSVDTNNMSGRMNDARASAIQISEQASSSEDTARTQTALPIRRLRGPTVDDYKDKVESFFVGDPEDWRKALGEYMLFQFGLYDDPRSTPRIITR
ncbi:hypothetical protein [Burkholderia ubonensis]|uniref:hypothetical protein n=1 Tax=Burkholderia ubonensis TaxID=101571 RepID=UPI000AAC94F4|nr:hypothetical protein [Burkholderia ubonensis]